MKKFLLIFGAFCITILTLYVKVFMKTGVSDEDTMLYEHYRENHRATIRNPFLEKYRLMSMDLDEDQRDDIGL